LTIIKNNSALVNYPFTALSPEVVDLLQRTAKEVGSVSAGIPLKLFECYCDLLGAKVSYLSLSSHWYLDLVKGFLGALNDTSLIDNVPATRKSFIRLFGLVHNALRAEIPAMEQLGYDERGMAHNVSVWEEHRTKLHAERIQYWSCWGIESSKGKVYYLNLPCLWASHGQDFTEDFYHQWRLFFRKMAAPGYTDVTKMAKFLSEHSEDWPAVTFQHPQMIKAFFLAFMKDFFLDAYHRQLNLNSQIKAWGRFISNCEEIFIETGKWATPYQGGLPKPTAKSDLGLSSRKKVREDGVVVHEKLLTPVPLHVTDEEAIEILFRRIATDIKIVKLWALDQCRLLMARVRQRNALAKVGTPIHSGASCKSVEEIGPENICATFEKDGLQSSRNYITSHFGNDSVEKLADLLGLPTSEKLFPFQCLLVCEHPEITSGFFDEFQLCDDNGDYIGYIKSDGGANLIGYKDRRGKKFSEQVIELNARSQQWVEEIIEVTQPLREALRREGNPAWKELFITCGAGFSRPASARLPKWNRSKFKATPILLKTLQEQFAPYEHMLPCGMQQFLERVSLSTIRSSCGVEVYLRTKSVTEMAKALGHAQYDTKLLRRYLPDAILSFFQTRWIRIFQRSFICEAMKDSPYLLEAANFESMEELHIFLKNHALKDIPSHLRNPDNKASDEQVALGNGRIYISINVGIMTALLSLEAAVKASDKEHQVSGKARYWAEVSKAVSDEIERGHDSLLKEHLDAAKLHCNPIRMSKVIYVAAA
jgi:hypothetical protein